MYRYDTLFCNQIWHSWLFFQTTLLPGAEANHSVWVFMLATVPTNPVHEVEAELRLSNSQSDQLVSPADWPSYIQCFYRVN